MSRAGISNLGSPVVPFGLRGTVVALHASTGTVEVLFDQEFIGGTTLYAPRPAMTYRTPTMMFPATNQTRAPTFRNAICAPFSPSRNELRETIAG